MEKHIQQIQSLGVHVLRNHDDILIEIHRSDCQSYEEIDNSIKRLLCCTNKRVLLECPKFILIHLPSIQEKMKIVGERVLFLMDLTKKLCTIIPPYEVWSPEHPDSVSFLSEVRNEPMEKSARFLENMSSELPTQVEKMYTVYKVNNEPVGVVFPHIEPDTDQQGRLFWIGVHPNHKGKGYGKILHSIGLYRLQVDFRAKTYLGATRTDNKAMRKIMLANDCIQQETSVMSLEYKAKL